MIRIKQKLDLSSSSNNNILYSTTTTSSSSSSTTMTTSIDKYIHKNNKSALNEFFRAINYRNNINTSSSSCTDLFESLFMNYTNKAHIIEDLFNFSCTIGDLELLDKVINYIQTINIATNNSEEKFKLSSNNVYCGVQGKNVDVIKKLVEFAKKKSNLGEYYNEEFDETSLIRAVKNQELEQVKILVDYFGASIELCDSKKRTPLHFAASLQSVDILVYLIEKGANLNSQCAFNDTALINACMNRNYKQIEILIKKGANIDLKGNYGNLPMHILVSEPECNKEAFNLFFKYNVNLCLTNDKDQTCFVRACSTTNLNVCEILLNELIKRYSNQTRPHSLCFSPKEDKFKKLKIKTNFEFLNTEIINGLLNATCHLRLDIVKYLFKFSHDKYSLCNELKDCFENKILITAIQRKDINEFNYLFKLFMSYDCYPSNETFLFYVSMLIKYWNVKLHIPSQYTFEPLEVCIQELINLLMYYNKYKYQQLEQIFFQLFPGVDENIILYSLCMSFRRRFGSLHKKPKSLKLLAKNVIRNSMVSLSDMNLNLLKLPQSLQGYLIEYC